MKGFYLIWNGYMSYARIPSHNEISREDHERYRLLQDGEKILCIPESQLATQNIVDILQQYAIEKGIEVKVSAVPRVQPDEVQPRGG